MVSLFFNINSLMGQYYHNFLFVSLKMVLKNAQLFLNNSIIKATLNLQYFFVEKLNIILNITFKEKNETILSHFKTCFSFFTTSQKKKFQCIALWRKKILYSCCFILSIRDSNDSLEKDAIKSFRVLRVLRPLKAINKSKKLKVSITIRCLRETHEFMSSKDHELTARTP